MSLKNIFNKIYVIFVFLLFLFSCNTSVENKKNSEKVKDVKKEESPSLHIEGFSLKETQKGISQWEIKGEYADIYENKNLVYITKIQMIFYNKDQIFSNLEAQNAELNMTDKNVTLKNNVKVVSKNNVTLETEKLIWNASKQILETDGPVKILKKGSILTGVGLITTPNLDNIKILDKVKIQTEKRNVLE